MAVTEVERIPIIDTDAHSSAGFGAELMAELPQRWRDYIATFGVRGTWLDGDRPRQRPAAARTDTWGPNGMQPASDPVFTREQLLDRYDFSGAIINDIGGFITASGGRQHPDEMAQAIARGMNDVRCKVWLDSDPRWYGSITVPHETIGAEKEIVRCMESKYADRWVQIMMPPDNEKPEGHKKYWPIYEACEHYGLVVGFHVLALRRITGTGTPNYYFEEHTQFADYNFPLVSSMIYEGVFDRFPKLKVGLIELAWSWAVPYAWRLNHAFDLLKDEVPHLERTPLEYVQDHFWYSTQPMEEPERLEWQDDVFNLTEYQLGDKLMYSSDYPHWDFDEPSYLPSTLPIETRRKVLGQNASKLYGIPLLENSGLVVELETA